MYFQWKKVHWLVYLLINFCKGSCMSVNNSGPIVFSVKKVRPSKVESRLEVDAWTDRWQQDLRSEYGQGLAYWTHKYYTGHTIASYCFQSLIGLANSLTVITCYKFHIIFKRLTREHENDNYLSFGCIYLYVVGERKVAKWQTIHLLLLIF